MCLIGLSVKMISCRTEEKSDGGILLGRMCGRSLQRQHSQCGRPIRFGVFRTQPQPAVFLLFEKKAGTVPVKVCLAHSQGLSGENSPGGSIRSELPLRTV